MKKYSTTILAVLLMLISLGFLGYMVYYTYINSVFKCSIIYSFTLGLIIPLWISNIKLAYNSDVETEKLIRELQEEIERQMKELEW